MSDNLTSAIVDGHQVSVETRTSPWLWLGPSIFMLMLGFYYVGRYAGMWSENDSAALTVAVRAIVAEGRLIPSHGPVYANGYAYQAIAAFVMSLTGLDAATLQQLVYPLTAAIVVIPAWVLYRELTGSERAATLATMLLLTQPEFLFVVLRSSHEKFLRLLMLMALYWLVRSLRAGQRPGQIASYIMLFYCSIFAMIASNNLLANSFIFAVTMALGLGWLLQRRIAATAIREMAAVRRLFYVLVVSLCLVFMFTFYAYSPATSNLLVLKTALQRITSLFLNQQSQTVNPYTRVQVGWINLPVYFTVSLADWIVLLASFAIWLRQGYSWIWRRREPESQLIWVVWLLYAALGLQAILSIVSDVTGAVAGSNVQERAFPSLSMISVILVGNAIARWRLPSMSTFIRIVLAVTAGIIAVLSIVKATNEPLLTDNWTFYKPGEIKAMDWAAVSLSNAQIWTEFDGRLTTAYKLIRGTAPHGNHFVGFDLKSSTRYILLSATTVVRASRLPRPLPVPAKAIRLYDNGESQLYHVLPVTPFQR